MHRTMASGLPYSYSWAQKGHRWVRRGQYLFQRTRELSPIHSLKWCLPRSIYSARQKASHVWCWSTKYGQVLHWQPSSASGLAAL